MCSGLEQTFIALLCAFGFVGFVAGMKMLQRMNDKK